MKKIIFLFASLIAFGTANAQTSSGNSGPQVVQLIIPQVALIKVSGTMSTFQFVAPTAGNNFADATATGTSIQYTSILAPAGLDRCVYVTSTGTSSKGFNLSVTATNGATTNANGVTGIPATTSSKIFVSSSAAPVLAYTGTNTFGAVGGGHNVKLVTGIQSGYTGSATADGPQLTYTASVGTVGGGAPVVAADYAALRSGTYSFSVYFTLADNV